MLQIIKAILRNPDDNTQIDLIFANVNAEDILLKEDLDELSTANDNFRVHYVLNNPPHDWAGGVGFVTADMIKVCYPRYTLRGFKKHLTISRSTVPPPLLMSRF